MPDSGEWAGTGIRTAVAADYPALRAAAALCGPAAQERLPDMDTFAALVEEVPTIVAVSDDVIVGYLLASPLAYDGDMPVSLWLEGLAIVPSRRRRGLATALCAVCAAAARAAGTRALLASPPTDPTLAALLARVGFVVHRDGLLLWRLPGS